MAGARIAEQPGESAVLAICAATGDEVIFENRSENATSYQWDFGDGTTSSDANPVKKYTESGNYIVTLKAVNSSETSQVTDTLMICLPDNRPVSAFTIVRSEESAYLITIENNSTNASSFVIEYGHGVFEETDGFSERTHTFPGPGSYAVTLTAYNSEGCYCSTRQTLLVDPYY